MNVICFGDSNTYGYDPRSFFGGRYDADCRWVDILSAESGWSVKNEGRNGREIPSHPIVVSAHTDMLIVMLGTNDLLQGRPASQASERMEHFLCQLDIHRSKLVLLAPPPMQLGEWVPNRGLITESVLLSRYYGELAGRLGVAFVDSGGWDIPMAYDGVHFTEEGHRKFANALYQELKRRVEHADSGNEST